MKTALKQTALAGILFVLLLTAVPVTVFYAPSGSVYTYGDIVNRLKDLSLTARLPLQGESSDEFSSTDPASKYNDTTDSYVGCNANADGVGFLYEQKDGGKVIAEMN